jgi:hypothetical protein
MEALALWFKGTGSGEMEARSETEAQANVDERRRNFANHGGVLTIMLLYGDSLHCVH